MREAFLFNSFNIAGLFLAITIIAYTVQGGGLKNIRRKTYLFLLLGIALSASSCIASWFMEPFMLVENGKNWLWMVRKINDCIYFAVHISMAAFFAFHIVTYLGILVWRRRRVYFWFLSPLLLAYAIILIDPFTNFLFDYVPVNGIYSYQRGPMMVLFYIMAGLYSLFGIITLFLSSKAVSTSRRLKIVAIYSISFLGLLAQGINENIQIEIFCEALTALGLYLSLENRRNSIDPTSLALNRVALVDDFRRLFFTGHRFTVITVRFDNLPHYSRVLSATDRVTLLRKFSSFLSDKTETGDIYRAGSSRFIAMIEETDHDKLGAVAESIHDFLSAGIVVNGFKINLAATVAIVRVPEDMPSVDALLNLLEMPEDPTNRDFLLVEGENLAFMERKLAVEKAIRTAIKNKSFVLHYQPIYDPKTKSMRYAEALLRLKDDELGNIPPAEFIPIAEKASLIGEIGRQLFAQACEFVGSFKMEDYGLKYIEVNLSPLQLYAKDLADELLMEMKKNGVEPRHINLEVTEAAALSSSFVCQENVKRLMDKGVTFSLDDFGSGYANFTTLASLPFDNIKVDMEILRILKTDEQYRRVYAGVVKALGAEVNIVQEGVEEKEDLDWLLTLVPSMKIQGFYFSKALPAKDFLAYVKKFNNQKKNA